MSLDAFTGIEVFFYPLIWDPITKHIRHRTNEDRFPVLLRLQLFKPVLVECGDESVWIRRLADRTVFSDNLKAIGEVDDGLICLTRR